MKKINILTTLFVLYFANCGMSQITMGIFPGTTEGREVTIKINYLSSFTGQFVLGYFFVLRTPIPNNSTMPVGPIPANFLGGPGLASDLVARGQTSSGTHLYQMWELNTSGPVPNGGTGSDVVLVSFDMNHGINVGTVELADDSFSDALIDAALGGGFSGSVFGSDINVNNMPTVNGYHQPIINNFVFPITLTSFDVKKYTAKSAKLNWTTSSEINSEFYGIERSKDGNIWENIAKVAAAGNSQSELSYQFIDDNLPLNRTDDQIFYYRLRMTDLDGSFKYSDVRGVNFGKSYNGFVTIYPNPTVEHINVDLSGMDLDGGIIDLSVYSMSGQMMIKKNIIGNGIELIDVTQLPSSTYNVVVKQGDTLYQQRVIKID